MCIKYKFCYTGISEINQNVYKQVVIYQQVVLLRQTKLMTKQHVYFKYC